MTVQSAKTGLRTVFSAVLVMSVLFALCSCNDSQSHIPVVTYEDKKIYIDGEYKMESEKLKVNRIDDRVVSLTTDNGVINMDSRGFNISLSNVITDRFLYEATIRQYVSFELAVKNTDIYYKFLDKESMMKVLFSYDEAMKLPFSLTSRGVSIQYHDDRSHLTFNVTYDYDSPLINPDYRPGEGVTCYSWMTGKLGEMLAALTPEGYKDYWVEDSLQINNYNGETYYWFCVSFKNENGDKTYCSAIAKEYVKGDRRIIRYEKTDSPFVCSDINVLEKMIGS